MKQLKKILFLLIFFLSLGKNILAETSFSRTQILFYDVPVTVTLYAPRTPKALIASQAAFDEARRLELILSDFLSESDVSKINQAPINQRVEIHPETKKLIQASLTAFKLTSGYFNPTFSSPEKIDFEKSYRLRGNYFYKLNSKANYKFSGIAKGFIVDFMGHKLRQKGFSNFIIDAGGDVLVGGRHAISIRNPFKQSAPPLCEVKLNNEGISTSGSTVRGFHIINPKTGKPIAELASSTAIARSSTMADSFDTGIYAMGKNWRKIISDNVKSIVILNDGKIESVGLLKRHQLNCGK